MNQRTFHRRLEEKYCTASISSSLPFKTSIVILCFLDAERIKFVVAVSSIGSKTSVVSTEISIDLFSLKIVVFSTMNLSFLTHQLFSFRFGLKRSFCNPTKNWKGSILGTFSDYVDGDSLQ